MTAVVRIRIEKFGSAAVGALGDEVAEAQRDDPLAPVTVVVFRGTVGLASRRLLAAGGSGGDRPGAATPSRPGVVNVRFPTLARLAADLGEGRLMAAGKSPGSEAVVSAAAREALARGQSPLFDDVRDHPATVRSVVAAYRDLRGVPPAALRTLADQSARAAQVVSLVGRMRRLLGDWYDEVDLVEAAADAIREDPSGTLDPLGHVIAYLPPALPSHHYRLLDAIGGHGRLTLIAGVTGAVGADEPVGALVDRFGSAGAVLVGGHDVGAAAALAAIAAGSEPVTGTAVLSAPSAEAEILAVLRSLVARLDDGIPLERMAIVHGAGSEYPRLIHESLSRAAILFNGPGVRPLSATVAGRVLLGLFELPEGGWRRDDVIAWLATGPLRHRSGVVPAAAWDRVSRQAGVVSRAPEWAERLASYARAQRWSAHRDDLAGEDRDPDAFRAQAAQNAEWAESLAAFVGGLVERCGQVPRSWSGWVRWAQGLLGDLLGGPPARAAWPADEVEAFTTLDDALGELAVLDGIEPSPGSAAFRSALATLLERPAPQTTRFGRGVLVAGVADAVGLDLDVLFVVGMDDGAFPARHPEDALLPDSERAAAGPDVPLRKVRAPDALRDYLAAMASAKERHLSFARGDQRHRADRRPSRWLLDTVATLASRETRLYAGDLATLGEVPGYRSIPSFTAAVRAPGEALDLPDRDLRSLAEWTERAGQLDGHPLVVSDPVLASGLRAGRQRRSRRFTRFDGFVDRRDIAIPSPAGGAIQSPTGLAAYATCPRRYFFGSLLRVGAREEDDAALRITPRDRGSLVHEILERFISEEMAGPTPARPPGEQTSEVEEARRGVARITAVAAGVLGRYEQAGLTGRPLLWQLDRSAILGDLRAFVRADRRYRSLRRAVPEAVELAFGVGAGPEAVEVGLSAGRRVLFRGSVDRLDRAGDGSVIVIDYKTGDPKPYRDVEHDPLGRGDRLQLPIYGLAARQRFGDVPVQVLYWFVSPAGKFEQRGFDLTPDVEHRLEEVLGTLVDGVEAGIFPARPGARAHGTFENCRYCAFTAACPADRGRAWERVRSDPALDRYRGLVEPGVAAALRPDAGGEER